MPAAWVAPLALLALWDMQVSLHPAEVKAHTEGIVCQSPQLLNCSQYQAACWCKAWH